MSEKLFQTALREGDNNEVKGCPHICFGLSKNFSGHPDAQVEWLQKNTGKAAYLISYNRQVVTPIF